MQIQNCFNLCYFLCQSQAHLVYVDLQDQIKLAVVLSAISIDTFNVTFCCTLYSYSWFFIVQDEDEFPELNSDNGNSKSSNIQQKISPKVVSNSSKMKADYF